MANNLQQANEPTLASVLQLHKEDVMYSINCHQVGEIVSFNPSTQTAEVQIKMLRMMNGELKQYPVLVDCPCVVLSGGNGRLTMPINPGDSCLVLFNDKDIDNWYSGGQTVSPRTERKHSFSDAIALVGIRNKQNEISGYLNNGVELKYGGSTIKLENNKVTVTNATATVEMNSATVTVTSTNISLVGNVAVTGSFSVNGKDIGPNHVHSGVSRGNSNTNGVL